MNETRITPSVWHNFQSLVIENHDIRLETVPDLGAKIVSCLDKKHSFEWLAAPFSEIVKPEYGANFTDQNMCGWDEMFPTIIACEWGGIIFPDHGELWSLPWNFHTTDELIACKVQGIAFPYHLKREISIDPPDSFILKYSLRNDSVVPFPWLWAAHPQFNADENTRIVFPDTINSVVNVVNDDPVFGKSGTVYTWPKGTLQNSEQINLDRIQQTSKNISRKFYGNPEIPVNRVEIKALRQNCSLRMEWDAEKLPYAGIWIDEGQYNQKTVIAIEPSNAYFDSHQIAMENQKLSWTAPGKCTTWEIRITIS